MRFATRFASSVLIVAAMLASPLRTHAEQPAGIRLYAIDCGRAEFADLGPFSDTGEYDGKPGTLMAACFLVRHPKGLLLWDAGFGDRYHAAPTGTQIAPGFRVFVPTSLQSQLAALGLSSASVDLFAFSHGHADHLGNANALTRARWIVNKREREWLLRTPPPGRTNPVLISGMDANPRIEIEGDYDVFGDGTVRILAAPGHTPGHQVLLVHLAQAGWVMLSGDLYHTRENRAAHRMPVFNTQRAETLASFDRIERIIANHKARLVIQHSREDFAAMPRFPAYLE